jgi:hypothetical protein
LGEEWARVFGSVAACFEYSLSLALSLSVCLSVSLSLDLYQHNLSSLRHTRTLFAACTLHVES